MVGNAVVADEPCAAGKSVSSEVEATAEGGKGIVSLGPESAAEVARAATPGWKAEAGLTPTTDGWETVVERRASGITLRVALDR